MNKPSATLEVGNNANEDANEDVNENTIEDTSEDENDNGNGDDNVLTSRSQTQIGWQQSRHVVSRRIVSHHVVASFIMSDQIEVRRNFISCRPDPFYSSMKAVEDGTW